MTIVVYTAPTTEPLSVNEVMAHLRLEPINTTATTDTLLASMITAARNEAEQELHRYLITQTLDAYFDAFPGYDDNYEILLPPLSSATVTISYVDADGTTQTLAADQYSVDIKSQPARISPAYGLSWPSTRTQNNAVTVRFVGGYGAASAVPSCVKIWMLMRIFTMLENRNQIITGSTVSGLPTAFIDGLLDPERVTYRV